MGLPEHEPGLESDQYATVKEAVLHLARTKGGSFDANEALIAVLKSGPGMNAETVTLLLDDLTGAGFIRQLPGGGEPDERARWELVDVSGPNSPGG